jgi:DNA-binding NarL/FixJ family response regulator
MKATSPLPPFRISGPLGSTIATGDLEMSFPIKSSDQAGATEIEHPIIHTAQVSGLVKIGLVDSFALTRGCLIETLTTPGYGFTVMAFETTSKLVVSEIRDLDVILYYDHEQGESRAFDTARDARIREQFGDVPVIVLSDATTTLIPQTVRAALKCGIRGFISAQTFEMRTVSAAIRFVIAGGVFAPVDLLLADDVRPAPAHSEEEPPDGFLTPRQMTVLSLLQQGKANKIIAYELGMSESTVKVHIRNIMRKMGATNRTQAIYKLRQLSNDRAIEARSGLGA